MENAFMTSLRDLLLLRKPRMSKKYQQMGLIYACQAHVKTWLETGQVSTRKKLSHETLTTKEIERRRKISETKKGSIPWNKGRKHPQETIERIRERTLEALSDPKVRKKMKGKRGPHSKEAKEKISTELKQIWHERLRAKCQQDRLHADWAQIIATAGKIGGYSERELDWDSYNKIRAEITSEEMREKVVKRTRRREKKVREEILERIKVKKAAERGEKRRKQTAAVKTKINGKHGSLKANLKLKERLTKLHCRKKRLDMFRNSKEIAPDTRRSNDEWDIEFIKERVEIGASLSDQLQLVMDRRKAEIVPSD